MSLWDKTALRLYNNYSCVENKNEDTCWDDLGVFKTIHMYLTIKSYRIKCLFIVLTFLSVVGCSPEKTSNKENRLFMNEFLYSGNYKDLFKSVQLTPLSNEKEAFFYNK